MADFQGIQNVGTLGNKGQTGISGDFQPGQFQQRATPGSALSGPTQTNNLQGELAAIQALRASQTNGGIGATVGGAAGTGIGAAFGGPAGAAIGGAVGGGLGSIVDYGLNKQANDRANRKEIAARKKQLDREKRLSNSRAQMSQKTRIRGIAEEIEQGKMTEEMALASERENLLQNMMNDINKKAQFDDFLKSKYIQSRSV